MREYRAYFKTITKAYEAMDMVEAVGNGTYDVTIRTWNSGYRLEWRTYV